MTKDETLSPPLDSRAVQSLLLLQLGRALHESGFPTPELEQTLGRLSHRFGIRAQFFSSPTSLFFAFGEGLEQRTHLERVEPAGVHLGRLDQLARLVRRLEAGELEPGAALEALRRLGEDRSRYPALLVQSSWGIASATSAIFLGGSLREAVVAGVIGIVTGLWARLLGRQAGTARLFEPVAAASAALLASAAAALWPPVSHYVATVAGIIFLLPGFTLTVALSELAQRHLSAGTSRLANALVTFLTVTFGTALGTRLGELAFGTDPSPAVLLAPAWAEPLALLFSPLALAVLFQAPLRAAPWIFAVGFLGLQLARIGGELLSAELGMFLGSWAIAVFSAWLQRRTGRPAALTLVPALILLVPGAIGYRSLASLAQGEVVLGVETAFRMLRIAVSLVAGLLVAAAFLPDPAGSGKAPARA